MKKISRFAFASLVFLILSACDGNKKAYDGAAALYDAGDLSGAVSAFAALGGYKDGYNRAAEAAVEMLNGYSDALAPVKEEIGFDWNGAMYYDLGRLAERARESGLHDGVDLSGLSVCAEIFQKADGFKYAEIYAEFFYGLSTYSNVLDSLIDADYESAAELLQTIDGWYRRREYYNATELLSELAVISDESERLDIGEPNRVTAWLTRWTEADRKEVRYDLSTEQGMLRYRDRHEIRFCESAPGFIEVFAPEGFDGTERGGIMRDAVFMYYLKLFEKETDVIASGYQSAYDYASLLYREFRAQKGADVSDDAPYGIGSVRGYLRSKRQYAMELGIKELGISDYYDETDTSICPVGVTGGMLYARLPRFGDKYGDDLVEIVNRDIEAYRFADRPENARYLLNSDVEKRWIGIYTDGARGYLSEITIFIKDCLTGEIIFSKTYEADPPDKKYGGGDRSGVINDFRDYYKNDIKPVLDALLDGE